MGKITLSAKGITNEITNNHPIDICSVPLKKWCCKLKKVDFVDFDPCKKEFKNSLAPL